MSFWVAAIVLTALAVLSVLVPLVRRRDEAGPVPAASDIEVYRDQLAELARDADSGLIGAGETEEARAEIGRRILRAARAGAGEGPVSSRDLRRSRAIALAAVVSVPLVGWGVYAGVGSPDLPGQPLAARLSADPANASVEELVARAETHLTANPDDGRGWDVLAPIYFRIGRYDAAAEAYRNAIRLLGTSAVREAGLGEAVAGQAGGLITADSKAAFERALSIDPGNAKARFFLASALAQSGRLADATAAWTAMRDGLPADSPWRGAVEQALGEAARQAAAEPMPGQPGPSQADVDAAASMPDADRADMIAGMVARLDQRLKENPKDAEGWQRLVRSYAVLGKADEARDALSRGMAALGEGSPQATELEALAVSLGLTRTE